MRKKAIIVCLCVVTAAGLAITLWVKSSSIKKLPDLSRIVVDVKVQRLERVLFSLNSKEEIRTFLAENASFATQFLGMGRHMDEGELVERLYAMVQDEHIQALHKEVERVFGDFSAVEQQFKEAFRYLLYYYPDFKVPQLATFITGMGRDLFLGEDLIVIGLDFFMGEGAKFRPIELPEYILRAYEPAYIVPKTMLLLSRDFIETDESDQTLLAEILHYGKAYCFAQAMLPTVASNVILGYTPEQWAAVMEHQDVVWQHFIEEALLYTTNHFIKNKYISDRPFTSEIGQGCPGNIGRWLGWEVVKSYRQKHNEVSLPALMQNTDTQALFSQAKYRPGK